MLRGCIHVGILCNQLIHGQRSVIVSVGGTQRCVERIVLEVWFLVIVLVLVLICTFVTSGHIIFQGIEETGQFLLIDGPVPVHIGLVEANVQKLNCIVIHKRLLLCELVFRQISIMVDVQLIKHQQLLNNLGFWKLLLLLVLLLLRFQVLRPFSHGLFHLAQDFVQMFEKIVHLVGISDHPVSVRISHAERLPHGLLGLTVINVDVPNHLIHGEHTIAILVGGS